LEEEVNIEAQIAAVNAPRAVYPEKFAVTEVTIAIAANKIAIIMRTLAGGDIPSMPLDPSGPAIPVAPAAPAGP
jgi:hypothetical protein